MAAVAFDVATGINDGSSPASISHAGSASATAVVAAFGVANGTDTSATVTYGGETMTKLRNSTNYGSSSRSFLTYYLINPPTGTQTLEISWGSGNIRGVVMTFTGQAERVANSVLVGPTTDSDSSSLAVSCDDDTNGLAVLCEGHNANAVPTAGTGETRRGGSNGGTNAGYGFTADANGDNTFSWSGMGATTESVGHGFSLEPNAVVTPGKPWLYYAKQRAA